MYSDDNSVAYFDHWYLPNVFDLPITAGSRTGFKGDYGVQYGLYGLSGRMYQIFRENKQLKPKRNLEARSCNDGYQYVGLFR